MTHQHTGVQHILEYDQQKGAANPCSSVIPPVNWHVRCFLLSALTFHQVIFIIQSAIA